MKKLALIIIILTFSAHAQEKYVYINQYNKLNQKETTPSVWGQVYALEKKEKYKQAVKIIEKIEKTEANADLITLRLAKLNYLQGKYNQSVQLYQKAIKANQYSIEALLGIFQPLSKQKRHRLAAKYIKKALKVNPYNYKAGLKLMGIYADQNKWTSLEIFAKKMIVRYQNSVESLVYLARAYYYGGKKNKATQVYKRVLVLMPSNTEAEYNLIFNKI
jgi:tetratricopeptide (TPR) repeat protein